MTLVMTPVMEKGHEPGEVNQWTLEQMAWWYLLRSRRLKARADAQREAQNSHDRR